MLTLYMSFIDDEKDKSKFEILYYLYRKRMVQMAYVVLINKEDAEDAVHETFIKIARNIKSIGDTSSKSTLSYVLKATKNTAINMKNRKDHLKEKEIIDDYEKFDDDDFIDQLDIKSRYNTVVDEITKLDDIYNDVLFYHFVSEMKVSEIAELLDINKSTVKQRLVRGKKLLLNKIKEKDECYCE